MGAKILIVSQDPTVRDIICRHISQHNYQVQSVPDAEYALAAFEQFGPDLLIIDDNLPDEVIYDLNQSLKHRADVLVLILTGRKALAGKTNNFWRRCDDFLVKSFDLFLLELEWRVKALLDRQWQGQAAVGSLLTVDNLVINPICREVAVGHQKVELTTLEFDLLYCLANCPGQVWRREELIRQVWGCEHVGNPRVVDIHIANIRKKLQATSPSIRTVKGVGYKLEASHSPTSVSICSL